MNRDDRFHYENPRDYENEISVYIEEDRHWEREYIGWLCVSVADEKAVDSYNSTFTCDIHMPPAAAIKLRDFLNKKYPT